MYTPVKTMSHNQSQSYDYMMYNHLLWQTTVCDVTVKHLTVYCRFQTRSVLIWFWSDTGHWQPMKIAYHIYNWQAFLISQAYYKHLMYLFCYTETKHWTHQCSYQTHKWWCHSFFSFILALTGSWWCYQHCRFFVSGVCHSTRNNYPQSPFHQPMHNYVARCAPWHLFARSCSHMSVWLKVDQSL